MGTLSHHKTVRTRLGIAVLSVAGALCLAIVFAGAVATPRAAAQAGNCAGIRIYGPAEGVDAADVFDLSQTKIGRLGKQATPLAPVGCEGDLLVIPWANAAGVAVVLRREVATNVRAELPDCPTVEMAANQSQYDRSSMGAGGGRLCKPKK